MNSWVENSGTMTFLRLMNSWHSGKAIPDVSKASVSFPPTWSSTNSGEHADTG